MKGIQKIEPQVLQWTLYFFSKLVWKAELKVLLPIAFQQSFLSWRHRLRMHTDTFRY